MNKHIELPALVDKIMEQAQVFASAWSLVGGPFDSGDLMEQAGEAKHELRSMVADAIAAQQRVLAEQAVPVAYWIPKAEQFCLADPKGRPFAKAWEPLYAAPVAQPATTEQAEAPSDDCLSCSGTGSGGFGIGCTDCLGTGRDSRAQGCPTCKRTDGNTCDWCPSIHQPAASPEQADAPSDARCWSPPDSFAKNWLTNGAALHPLTANLVVRFARALAAKLAAAEVKYGYSDGWRSADWMDECRAKLAEHVAKGDPRDVAAYCAFLWHHGESTATQPTASAAGERLTFSQWFDGLTTEDRYDFDSDGRGFKKDSTVMMRKAWNAALATQPTASNAGERATADTLSFICTNGCGYCGVKLRDFVTHATQAQDSDTWVTVASEPEIVSTCCGHPVEVWDERKQDVVAEVRAALASKPVAPPAREATKLVQRWMEMIDYAYQCRDDIRSSSGATPRSQELRLLADEMSATLSATTPAPAGQRLDLVKQARQLAQNWSAAHDVSTCLEACAFALASPPEKITEEMHAAAVSTLVRCTGNDEWPQRVWDAMHRAARGDEVNQK